MTVVFPPAVVFYVTFSQIVSIVAFIAFYPLVILFSRSPLVFLSLSHITDAHPNPFLFSLLPRSLRAVEQGLRLAASNIAAGPSIASSYIDMNVIDDNRESALMRAAKAGNPRSSMCNLWTNSAVVAF